VGFRAVLNARQRSAKLRAGLLNKTWWPGTREACTAAPELNRPARTQPGLYERFTAEAVPMVSHCTKQ
jgi:hypothetical protein